MLFEGKKRKFVRINLLVKIFLFVCAFLNKKYMFSYTFDLCGWVGDKKIFYPTDFQKQDYFFFGLRLTSKFMTSQPG